MVNPPERPQGLVITFYSYKGGVGRTMALANVAALLAQRGKRVLVVDWDLEAPGIEKYFTAYLSPDRTRESVPGIVDLIIAWEHERPIPWREALLHPQLPSGHGEVHLLTAGRSTPDYVQRMRSLQFERLFEQHALGHYLEQLREEWRESYDFVLIDSRTGITDLGGICTIHLPDVLVALFTTNAQSLEGTQFVLSHARKAHASLPVDRRLLLTVPVLARDETENLPDEAKVWHEKAASALGMFYADWLPREVPPVKAVEFLKLPYAPAWSLGERLPVVEQGTANPRYLGFAYELLTRLLASGVDWNEVLTGTLRANSTEIRAQLAEQERLVAMRRVEEAERARAELLAEQKRREAEQWAFQQRLRARQTRNWIVGLAAGLIMLGLASVRWFTQLENASRKRTLGVLGTAAGVDDPLERVLLVAEVAKELKSEDFTLLQRDRTDYLPEVVLESSIGEPISVEFSPDGSRILVIGAKGIELWEVETGLLIASRQEESKTGTADTRIRFSPDGTRALTVHAWTLRLWSVANGRELATLDSSFYLPRTARFSPDGRLVMADEGKAARIFDAVSGERMAALQADSSEVTSEFSPDGRLVLIGSDDETVSIWDVASRKHAGTFRGHLGKVISARFSPDGSLIQTTSWDRTAIWDVASGKLEVILKGSDSDRLNVTDARFSPDGRLILITSLDKTAIWDVASGKFVAPLKGDLEAISPDGRLVLTVSFGRAGLWEATSGKLVHTLEGDAVMKASARFSPDGKRLLTVSYDGTTHLWDVESARPLATFREGNSGTGSFFSPDSRYVLTGGKEGTARLWNATSGQPVAVFKGRGSMTKATFSPNSQRLLTVDEQGMGQVWSIPPTPIQWSDPQSVISMGVRKACLAPAQRIKYLQEEPDEAEARFKDCEARLGKRKVKH